VTPGTERDPWVLGPPEGASTDCCMRAVRVPCVASLVSLCWRFVLLPVLLPAVCCACAPPPSGAATAVAATVCVRVSALKNKLNQTTFINSSTYPDDMIYLVDKARDVLHFITGVTGQATRSEVDNIDGDALAHSSNPSTRTIGGCTPQRTRPPAEPRPSQPSSTATRCAQTARDSTFKILRPATSTGKLIFIARE
jgi:hypothetical protein